MVVLCSRAQPGTELMCCVQSCWPLKDKCWVHWEAPTSSGLKEFSDCYISKTDSWKRAISFKTASESSGNPFPCFHLFFSRAGDGVYFSEVWKKKKNKSNFALGSLNYLHVASESFRVSQESLDSAHGTLTWWCMKTGALRGVFTPASVDIMWPWSL